ncbi:PqqD family protein [bacterium]|nr:PqqD family protein [bacterium]
MRRKVNFLLRKVGDLNILVPIGQEVLDLNAVITLNETGAYLWELLEEERSAEELAIALSEEFDVDIAQARIDVENFLKELRETGLVED